MNTSSNIQASGPRESLPPHDFWNWFKSAKSRVEAFIDSDHNDLTAYEELTTRMARVHPLVMPELTGDKDGTNVLVLTCDGRKEAAPALIKLAEAAPPISGWRIQRFRCPMDGFRTNYEGLDIDASNILFAHRTDREAQLIHVGLVVPGYSPTDQRFSAACFLALDHSIGEYNTMMHVGRIKLFAPGEIPGEPELLTLTQLRELIEDEFY